LFTIQHFEGGMDEAWYILVHVTIEARAGETLEEATRLVGATNVENESETARCLTAMSKVWDDVNAIFDRMPERCDPYVYFHRVRPWIHG
jgi:indoleamine 2,3-dioxygenase